MNKSNSRFQHVSIENEKKTNRREVLFGNERQQTIHKSHFSQININVKEIIIVSQHFNNCKRYIKNDDSDKTEKVYEIKREILLEKVNAVKKEIDQKLVISYCVIKISPTVDENTSSHIII